MSDDDDDELIKCRVFGGECYKENCTLYPDCDAMIKESEVQER